MNRFRAVCVGNLASLLLFLSLAGVMAEPAQSVSSCDFVSRTDGSYAEECLRYGGVRDARSLWESTPVGVVGEESTDFNRRSLCKRAENYGEVFEYTRSMYGGVIYRTFHNRSRVLGWLSEFVKADCERMGYHVSR